MKFKFDDKLPYQLAAIKSIVDIFHGQETCRTNFTVTSSIHEEDLPMYELGIGNRIRLLPEDILKNVQKIQLSNGLAQSEALDSMDFSVEMETGTGKTYVYLRSILELNKEYGFTKFIIVVPSIAIKEGVYKSLQMTEEHFKKHYENVPFDYFIYDSQKLGQVRNFATSDSIQIMIINIDAFRKSFDDPSKESKANIIHRAHDRMTGSKPIEFIQATNPIVIIDEPQSVDTTPKSKEAIKSLNPLCTLRFSATHVDKYNMVYKLDAVDAYQAKLVKQIEVASIEVQQAHNLAYIKLLKVDNRKSPITAQVEIDAMQRNGEAKRIKKTVKSGDDLLEHSGGRSIYDGYIVSDIYCEKGNEYISFTSKPDIIRLNQAIGEVNDDTYKQLQIKRTIKEHLEKELVLRPKGLKVLSLFFIDRVSNYRAYDADGNSLKGKYAEMFEKEYEQAIREPKYNILFEGADLETAAEGVHNGYFAIDKKKDASGEGRLKESSGAGVTQADESAYQLIMRDKEKLLSFDSKLKFIFSHSALREGWDNPNVFQICTLNETKSVMRKRQEIGRGMRIAVNQDGVRVHGFDVNTLTVMANESYEEFAKNLQKEIEEETGIKFGIVEKHLFANIGVQINEYQTEPLGTETSEKIWEHLHDKGYIDSKGRVQDSLRIDLKANEVDLPEDVSEHQDKITALLNRVAGKLEIKNADDKTRVKLNKQVFLGEDFKQLWDRIKYKTTFRVQFDSDELIRICSKEIKRNLSVPKARFIATKAIIDVDKGGVSIDEKSVKEQSYMYDARDFQLPDIIGYLQNETNLTRRSLVEIIKQSDRLQDFKNNPQRYLEQVAGIIKHQMRLFIVDGIKYEKIGDEHFYAQELFKDEELYGYLSRNMIESSKSVYEHVVYDSGVEEEFAKKFEINDNIKVYAKLPSWFVISTPLGTYNPDWAVLVELDGEKRLYFVVETKGSLFSEEIRQTEQAKIRCGKAHFQAMGNETKFTVANNYDTFMDKVFSE